MSQPLDYDEQRAARMLATLMTVPEGQQMDTLAAVVRCWLDRRKHGWGEPILAKKRAPSPPGA